MFYHLPTSALLDARARRRSMAVGPRHAVAGEVGALRHDRRNAGRSSTTRSARTAQGPLRPGDGADRSRHPELTLGGAQQRGPHPDRTSSAPSPRRRSWRRPSARRARRRPDGGWATQTALINPDTGQIAYNSQGQIQYVPVWSSETQQFAGQAISPALTTAKNDTTLGANITDIDPEGITDADPDAPDQRRRLDVARRHALGRPVGRNQLAAVPAAPARQQRLHLPAQRPVPGSRLFGEVLDVDEPQRHHPAQELVRPLPGLLRPLSRRQRQPDRGQRRSKHAQEQRQLSALRLSASERRVRRLRRPRQPGVGHLRHAGAKTHDGEAHLPDAGVGDLRGRDPVRAGSAGARTPYPATLDAGKITTVVFDISLPSIFLALAAAAGLTSLARRAAGHQHRSSSSCRCCSSSSRTTFAATSPTTTPTAFAIRAGVTIGTKLLTARRASRWRS